MFKKLRNKFLLLNMSMTTLVIFIAFFVVYFTTYKNIQSENYKKLENTSPSLVVSYQDTDNNTVRGGLPSDASFNNSHGTESIINFISEDYNLSFSIETDWNGNIQNINSFINMTEETYIAASKTAMENNAATSTMKLNGKTWLYQVDINKHSVINNSVKSSIETGYKISFLDITDSQNTLNNLLITFLLVAVAVLFAIFAVSLYFANRTIKPISHAWEKQRQFIDDASHELKTPLSVIIANYDALMANENETIKSQSEWFGYMKIGLDRMSKLTHDLLSLARIENMDASIIDKTIFNISSAIEMDTRSSEAAANEKGIRLTYNIQSDLIVNSNENNIRRVFNILLENALKYTNNGGDILVTLTKDKHRTICSVQNTGEGIEKQDLNRVFDRFYRADSARNFENGGYGLGLPIAKEIITRLGGKIYAQSIINESTIFTFSIDS